MKAGDSTGTQPLEQPTDGHGERSVATDVGTPADTDADAGTDVGSAEADAGTPAGTDPDAGADAASAAEAGAPAGTAVDPGADAASADVDHDVVGPAGRLAGWFHREAPAVVVAGVLSVLSGYVVGAMHPYDIVVYHHEAQLVLAGEWHELLVRGYPIGADILFTVPMLLPLPYLWSFVVLAGVALWLLVRAGRSTPWPERWAKLVAAYLVVGCLTLVVGRYDIFAAACAFVAVESARRGRWRGAWAWSSVGFLLKLFPAVMWPGFLIAQWRSERRLSARQLAWPVLASALWGIPELVATKGDIVAVAVARCPGRPLEVGSLAAGLSFLVHPTTAAWALRCHSFSLVAGQSHTIFVALVVGALAAGALAWLAAAKGRMTVEEVALVAVTALLLGSSVLSAQYVMWLVPLWAYYRGRWQWFAASVLTAVGYPYLYVLVSASAIERHITEPQHVPLLMAIAANFLARDLLIAWGTLSWLVPRIAARRRGLDPATAGRPAAGGSRRRWPGPSPGRATRPATRNPT